MGVGCAQAALPRTPAPSCSFSCLYYQPVFCSLFLSLSHLKKPWPPDDPRSQGLPAVPADGDMEVEAGEAALFSALSPGALDENQSPNSGPDSRSPPSL